MNKPHLQRAWMLLEQSRYELAEQELRQELAQRPDSAAAHAMLALCLSERNQFAEATQEAQQAIHLSPDDPFPHYALSCVWAERNRYDEAGQAIDEALRLDPSRPVFFAQSARILFAQRRWSQALEAAERGLLIDPEDAACTNLRAMTLVKLGRKSEAGEAMQRALERQPEDALTHANQGWTLIEQGQHQLALEHFREALRIDPSLDWARQGIVEALKARYLIYRWMLRYFLWMMKLSSQAKWGVVLGGYFAYRLLRGVARTNPDLAPWILPLLVLYVAFVVMTWVANPLFNLVLRLNRYGRLALSPAEIRTSNWVGACVAGALSALLVFFVSGWVWAMVAAAACGLLIPPLSTIEHCEAGWPRTTMGAITTALALLGLGSALLHALALTLSEETGERLAQLGWVLFLPFILGAFASQFAANALVMAVPRK